MIFTILSGVTHYFTSLPQNEVFKSIDGGLENEQVFFKKDFTPKTSGYWVESPILIDDTGAQNWTWVESQQWFGGGNGSFSNPYIIENITIDGGGVSSGIEIINSIKYFIVRNVTAYNSHEGSNPNYGAGIVLKNVENGAVIGNNCSFNSKRGLYLYNSRNVTVINNTIFSNNYYGLHLEESHNITVLMNEISQNSDGVYLRLSHDNNLTLNEIFSNTNAGINFGSSSDNHSIERNVIYDNRWGIRIWNINTHHVLRDNNFTNNGISTSISTLDIDTSNLVNGKPLYYYVNKTNLGASNFTNPGQIILFNCNDSILSDLDVSNSSIGIDLWYSYRNIINNITSNYNYYGLQIYLSEYNNVTGLMSSYSTIGLKFDQSNHNYIKASTLKYCYSGLVLEGDNNSIEANFIGYNDANGIFCSGSGNENKVFSNSIVYNQDKGMYITSGIDYLIYNNSFIGNTINAYDKGAFNFWYIDGLGNYWDDYPGVDKDDNGIGDTVYIISGSAGSKDNFPIWDDGPEPTTLNPPEDNFFLILLLSIVLGVVALLSLTFYINAKRNKKQMGELRENVNFFAAKLKGEITEDDITLSKEKHICLVHKGPVEGYSFICPSCGSYYCVKCLEAIKELENACWSCGHPLDPQRPVKKVEKKEEIGISDKDVKSRDNFKV
jgi:parallel beta-helix repeat protein